MTRIFESGRSVYVGAYWSARPESVETCSSRSLALLAALARISPRYEVWSLKAARRSAGRVLSPSADAVMAALLAGRNRRDSDLSVLDDLGYSMGLWNAQSSDPVSLTIRCGIGLASAGVVNSVVLNLPPASERSVDVYCDSHLGEVLSSMVECWAPDWASVTSNSLREAQAIEGAVFGYMTYLSVDSESLPSAEALGRIEPFEGGSIVAVARGISAPEREVLALAGRIRPVLDAKR